MNFKDRILHLLTISLVIAYDDLSNQKRTTQSTTYLGPYDWYKANNAVDRDITTCMRTDEIGRTSPDKTVWWKVDLGGVYNIYSVTILFRNYDGKEMRQRGRLAGFSIYVSKTGDIEEKYLCYKDGPQLPYLNFTTTCYQYGRYVIFYNERLPGVIYPSGYVSSLVYMELCEVTVKGCYSDGVYGSSCDTPCPSNCKTNTCSILNGNCSECKPGWMGATCNSACASGFYGVDCKQQCPGQCRYKVTCNHVTGLCDGGCADGLYGFNCTQRCSENCRSNALCNHVTGFCDAGCSPGWNGSRCDKECAECVNALTERTTTDTTTPSTGNSLPNSSVDTSSKLVVGGVVGACVAILFVAAIFLLIWFKRRSAGKPKSGTHLISQNKMDMAIDRHFENSKTKNVDNKPRHQRKDDVPILNITDQLTNKIISVKHIRDHLANIVSFKDEYQNIPRGEMHPCWEAKKPANNAKNRYTGLYPYDHSRVVLKNTQDSNDYINANYIENTRGQRCYIATQGPKSKTITDFWTMVWQEEVSTIVCLTNLKEGVKNKCTQYWPNINDKLQAGEITIRHVWEKTYSEHIVRQFKIYYTTASSLNYEDRRLTMYHYTTWADHGVADPLSLVVFHRQVMKATAQSTGKYTLVHCSAGIGRTGTYIAVDVLYREGERTGKIDVPMYVNTMRKDRMNMIQGEEQYRIVYLALMEAFSGPSKTMNRDVFTSEYREKNSCNQVALSSEFEELLTLRKEYSQKDYVSGRVHISANYTQSLLPLEEYMCRLSYKEGYNTYYNAIYLQSFLANDAIISAQYPLPDYSDDFLRLVWDLDARILVFLSPIIDLKSSSVWFPTKLQSKHSGEFTLKHLSITEAPHVTMTKLNLQKKGTNGTEINVFECPTWNDEQLTGDKRVLLDVIKEVKKVKNMLAEGRLVVLSSDGSTRCGPFCVVYNAIEQITTDGEVDIFTTARQLQVRRPEFLSTLAEYQLCHDAVGEYLSNDSVYGNC